MFFNKLVGSLARAQLNLLMEVLMNIFVLDKDPVESVKQHCDEHVKKMPIEAAQMLCTNIRLLEGVEEMRPSKSGKTMQKYWKHPNDELENVLYKVVHRNHPCTAWARESLANYEWLVQYFIALCNEYIFRYGKPILTDTILRDILSTYRPAGLPNKPFAGFVICMKEFPDCIVPNDPIQSYRNFYMFDKIRFASYNLGRPSPDFFEGIL